GFWGDFAKVSAGKTAVFFSQAFRIGNHVRGCDTSCLSCKQRTDVFVLLHDIADTDKNYLV
ncbi:TPA: hypothetical protein ACFNMI_002033, partial [Neisseria bacilliformis]